MKQLNSTDCAFFYFVGRVAGSKGRVSSVEVLNVRVDEQLVPLASRFSSMQCNRNQVYHSPAFVLYTYQPHRIIASSSHRGRSSRSGRTWYMYWAYELVQHVSSNSILRPPPPPRRSSSNTDHQLVIVIGGARLLLFPAKEVTRISAVFE